YFNFIFQGHLCQLLSFLTSLGGGIEKFCFKLSIVTFLSINAFAATQANTTDNRNFNIPKHYFNDNELYDKTNSTYKKFQGINYYAKSSKQYINNI
ncbi:hypothetical protein KXM89_000992, partial [Campylobacter jejuni]|nr:hypothetical protein [Campylobacter jejuni]